MASPLAQFITYLHTRAQAEGRVPELDTAALQFLSAVAGGPADWLPKTEEVNAGLELHDGRPHSDLARRIQRRAVSELTDLELTLENLDAAGYTTINLRALLSTHFDRLRYAPLGTDANCAYIDIK